MCVCVSGAPSSFLRAVLSAHLYPRNHPSAFCFFTNVALLSEAPLSVSGLKLQDLGKW